MNFIFAKLFEEYLRKKDLAKLSITLYISLCYFFLTFSILLPAKAWIDKNVFNGHIYYEKSLTLILVFGVLAIITTIVYYSYIANSYIYKLTEKYKERKIKKSLLYLIVALAPVTLLLISGVITVLLNGGKILGHNIHGLIE